MQKYKNHFIPFPILETERCILSRITEKNKAEIFSIYSDIAVMKYMQSNLLETADGARVLIAKWSKLLNDNEGIRWGVFLKSDPTKLVGTIALQYWNKSSHSIELGADLLKDFWGRGLAFEFTKPAIAFAFNQLNINRLELRCNPRNTASSKIAAKFGMTYEGTLREYVYIPNKGYDDESVYSILKREYQEIEK